MANDNFLTSYLIPARETDVMGVKVLRDTLSVRLVSLLQHDGRILSPAEAVVRDGLPFTDYAIANAQNTWLSPALTANTAAAHLNAALANTKYAGFWGFGSDDPKMVTVGVYLVRLMLGAAGNTMGRYQPERIWSEETPNAYFSEPVIFNPNQTVYAEITPRTTDAAGARLHFFSLIAEPRGPFVS